MSIDYRYNEGEILTELKAYVDKTYGQHYSRSKFQASEFIFDNGQVSDYVTKHTSIVFPFSLLF